jgi:hypothetical protein
MAADVDPTAANFMLSCQWTCRGDWGCGGGATYDFTPLKKGLKKP